MNLFGVTVGEWFFPTVSFVAGLLFGSFANVVIWRFPRGESLSSPPSHCPLCDTPIAWYDNVPIVSWLLLRARCRSCGASIPWRYPAVELLGGLLWLGAALAFGSSARFVFAAYFFYLLLVLAFIDLDTLRLPNVLVALVAAGGGIGVAVSLITGEPVVPLVEGGGALASPLLFALLGALASAGVALAIAAAYARLRKAEGFGMGDVKLLAAIGVYLGLYGLMVLFFASLIGAVVAVLATRGRAGAASARVPFGPFLALSAVLVTFVGPALWAWYLGFLA